MKISLTLLLALVLGLAIAQASAAATVSIGVLSSAPDETVTAPILISDVENYGTGTVNITYDPAVVHVIAVTSGPDSILTAWTADNTTGIVNISAWNIAGISGEVIFARVEFLAVGTAGTSTPLKLSVSSFQDTSYNDIPTTVIHGAFNIEVEETGSETTPTPTPTPTTIPTPTPTLTPTPTTTPTTTTTPTPIPTGNVTQNETPTPIVTLAPTPGIVTPPGKDIPGFGIVFACSALLIIYHVLSFRRREGK